MLQTCTEMISANSVHNIGDGSLHSILVDKLPLTIDFKESMVSTVNRQ